MDSDSEMSYVKEEPNSDTDAKRDCKINWTSENTLKLISLLKSDCRELWDTKHPLNKGRTARNARHLFLADVFQTTTDEISRKIHNLRAQFHSELRKIKRRTVAGGDDWGVGGRSSWEYFDALEFLLPSPSDMPAGIVDGVNFALAEFQANEEEEFGPAARSWAAKINPPIAITTTLPAPVALTTSTFTNSRIPEVSAAHSSHNLQMWTTGEVPILRAGFTPDDNQIFGDFVASELRNLRSNESRKILKRLIQKAILQIGEDEHMAANS